MGTASADLGRLATFVSAAQEILGSQPDGLRKKIDSLRTAYEGYQNTPSPVVANGDLLGVGPTIGGEIASYAGNLERDRLFVEAVRRAFEAAGGGSTGITTVGDIAFDRAFATAVRQVALEHSIDPQTILMQRVAITVDDPIANGVPPTSGFVNDPVCTATGHFLEVEEDFTWPERLAVLRWRRVYSSRFVTEGPFGRGWASWATVACAPQDDGSVAYQGPDGQLAVFTLRPDGDGYGRLPGLEATLRAAGDGWELAWDWQSGPAGEVWRFGADGRLASVAGPARGAAQFAYDDGRLVEVAHDSGRRLALDWDGDRVVAVRSSCGRVATYGYDDAGDLLHTGRMLGDRDYTTDDRGLIVEVHDADGVRLCRNGYDGEGRVVTQVTPYGREVTVSYQPGNRTVVSDTGGGPVEAYEHDGTGRLLAVTDHLGHRMERSFDAEGRCVSLTGFDGATVRNSFAGDDRSASRVDADGVSEHWEYDGERRVTGHRVEGGPALTFDYAGDSPVPRRVAGPDGWEMALDVEDGVLRSVTDADGVTATFEHDAEGNIVASANGLGAVTRIEPHVSGQVARMIAPDGATFTFERDPAGRMLSVRTPTGDVFRAEWTPAGRMAALVEPNGARTVYDSGSNGEVQRIVDALGAVVELQHDQLARLVGLAAPGGAKWGFEYTALGLLSIVTDPAGGVWQYGYDADGRQVSATDPLGHEVRQRYNPAGRLVELTDRSGNATRFGHDALGRVVLEEGPEGAVTTCEWDVWGRPRVVRSPDGETITYRYTPAGRVAGATTAEGRSWVSEYDAGGRLAAVTDASGVTTRFAWDACDRMVATTSPTGRVTRWGRDPQGRVVESEQGGRVWRTAYDHAGRVVAATDPAGATIRYAYDLAGRLVAVTDALGATVRIRYDQRGNPAGVVDALGGLVTTTYDPMRRPISVTDQLGRITRIERDAAGRPVRHRLPTGDVVEWRRNARGQTTDLRVNGRDVVVFDRDRAGRPVSIHEPAHNRTFSFGWTAGGKLRSLDVDGRELRWEHDADGRVTTRHDPAGRVTRYAYDPAGRLAAVGIDGLARIELDRDADGRLVALRAPGLERRWDHDAGGLVVGAHVTGPDGQLAMTYAHDDAGRVTEARSGSGVSRYRYDAAGQLVAAGRGADAWAWHYDPAGRLVREDGPDGTRRYSYDQAHQLVHVDAPRGRTTYAYDAAGRRTGEDGPDGSRRYSWDGLGRLAGIEADGRRRRLDVDALGRLAGVDGTTLEWDPSRAVAELLAIGDQPVIGAEGRVLGLGGDDGAPGWLAGEGRATTDGGDGRDPWGAGTATAGDGPALGYLGEVEVGGLVWLRNRVYDPATRQFLTPDPLPGIPGLPVAAHPYHYADNNPIGRVDPLGLQGQPLSIEDYNAYRKEAYGWQVNNLVTVGLVVVGVALMFTGVGILGSVAIGALLGAVGGAAPGVIHGVQTGEWNTSAIIGGAVKGAVIGGLAGLGGGALGALSRGGGAFSGMLTGATRGATAVRGGLAGMGIGAGSGTASELYDLTPLPGADGQFNSEGILVSTVVGGVTGAGGGAATFKPVPTAPIEIPAGGPLALPAGSSPPPPPRNVFPATADEMTAILGVDPVSVGTTPDGTPRIKWEPNSLTKIQMESHPEGLSPGDPSFNPRHHGEHYHIYIRPTPTTGWGNQHVVKLEPPGYTPGSGKAFLPGEPFP